MAIFAKYCHNGYIRENDTMRFKLDMSPKMLEVNGFLTSRFVGMNHCVSGLRGNLIVEVPKNDVDKVAQELKANFGRAVNIKKAYLMIDDLTDFILVKPLVSEAPVNLQDSVPVPSIEKLLVDQASDKEYSSTSKSLSKIFQEAFETYDVNKSKLLRYASRKGEKEEITQILAGIDRNRIEIVRIIQDYLRDTPVIKAWLFGSYARMEETDNSDVDILVDFQHGSKVGLLQMSQFSIDLEQRLKKSIDLVAEGSLKPFAADNVMKERVLIYERS